MPIGARNTQMADCQSPYQDPGAGVPREKMPVFPDRRSSPSSNFSDRTGGHHFTTTPRDGCHSSMMSVYPLQLLISGRLGNSSVWTSKMGPSPLDRRSYPRREDARA
ncbi:hypothetical protein EVAR_91757_1 [Eumeta japonica]|uniref:Uncharacterized protein n=1 Tax=Eumeta variegata TaxID=151549 RepID=A0A4C1SJA8_EUMVA|nr:hypothetical protein EVAR_91757_1 [Eumeta japonica]